MTSGPLLERDAELRALAGAARAADRGSGSVVLVSGEAGAGKTSLVRAFPSWAPAGARVVTGYCEALSTPRALGPLKDLVHTLGGGLREAVASGQREPVMSALVAALTSGPTTVLIVEDVHWADEGTLDVLRHVVRRIAEAHCVLVLTFRDDETPSRGLAALVATAGSVPRHDLHLAALSLEAVQTLCAGHDLDSSALHERTAGNPFLVTESLRWGGATTPVSVVAAVAERLDRLDSEGRALAELLAVIPGALEPSAAARLVGGAWGRLASVEEHGLVTVMGGRVAFRHELTRSAVLATVPGARQLELHRRVLDALLSQEDADAGRVVHHAVACGDVLIVIDRGPVAAREAAASGAVREAVAHYRTVLRHGPMLPEAERAALWEELGAALYRSGEAEAVDALVQAVALRRHGEDEAALVRALCSLSRFAWFAGRRPEAEDASDEAARRADALGLAELQALALGNRSQLAALVGSHDLAITLGTEAVAHASAADDRRSVARALTTIGTSLMVCGDRGQDELRQAIELARADGDDETACRAQLNLAWGLAMRHDVTASRSAIGEGLVLAAAAEHRAYEAHLKALGARLALDESDWDLAERLAGEVPDASTSAREVALLVEVLVSARTGRTNPFDLLHRLLRTQARSDRSGRRGLPAAAALEAAHLLGALPPVAEALAAYDEAREQGMHRLQAELAYRLGLVGRGRPAAELALLADETHSPYLLQATGRWREAAECWRALGRTYEEAQALTEGDEPSARLEGLRLLDHLGAASLAQRVRRSLREAGVASVPRGPSGRTRSNPHGLTDRQLTVLELVAEGLTNTEVAERLVVSRRTVETHMAAALAKLGAPNRRRAAELLRVSIETGSP